LLERHEDAIFTCGEAWKYWQIERTDPRLSGESKISSLMPLESSALWIQPDCNQPAAGAWKSKLPSKKIFPDTFGIFPKRRLQRR